MNKNLIIRSILSTLLLIVILIGIKNYITNKNETFNFLLKIDFKFIIFILFLSLNYLIIESFNQRKIIQIFTNQKEKLFICFLIINITYLLNTIFNFFGTFFRCVYLKKNYKVDIKDFIFFTLLLALLELFVFMGLTVLFNIVFQVLQYKDYLFILILILFLLLFFSLLIIYNFKKISIVLTVLNKKNFLFLKNLFIKYNKNLPFFFKLFFYQYIVLMCIYFSGFYELKGIFNIGFSSLASAITSISFFFNFTPLSIGITETMLYIGTKSMEIKFSEIIFLTGIFRVSLLIIYLIFGILSIIILQNKKKYDEL